MTAPFLSFDQVTLKLGGELVFRDTTWMVEEGQQWAIVGRNGSGKSLLVEAIRGRMRPIRGIVRHHFVAGLPGAEDAAFGVFPRGTLTVVSTSDLQHLATSHSAYLQARWHGSEGEGAPTLFDFLGRHRVLARHPFEVLDGVESEEAFSARREAALKRFGLMELVGRKVMQLSNGELRKLLLVRALLLRPKLLILDEPFAGLDAGFRRSLADIVRQLMAEGVKVLFVTARPEELPEETTHVLVVDGRRVVYQGVRAGAPTWGAPPQTEKRIPRVTQTARPELTRDQILVSLSDVTVRYGTTTVLHGVSFTQRGDENWAIRGPNGSGKSTLLSLILADNPQAYANDITLFGRRRGTGESIWDIKRKLGWMGADLHAQYPRSTSCLDVVKSGWFHSQGLHQSCSATQTTRAHEALAELGVEELSAMALGAVAHGEQRLVLLARALVQMPLLLVLDEPCQGLDAEHRALVLRAVDAIVDSGQSRILFVSHHHDELPRCITHILELDHGRVKQASPAPLIRESC